MRNLKLKILSVFSSGILIASCGGGGGSGDIGFVGGSSYGGSSYYINLKSLSIQETNPDGVISPNETFYIKWNADYSGASLYNIAFMNLQNNNVPDAGTNPSKEFISVNCGTRLIDCSKGLKCTYTKETDNYGNTRYYFNCSLYSTIPNFSGWDTPIKKEIDPYTFNYLGADAMVFEYDINSNGGVNIKEHHSKKAIPINLGL